MEAGWVKRKEYTPTLISAREVEDWQLKVLHAATEGMQKHPSDTADWLREKFVLPAPFANHTQGQS